MGTKQQQEPEPVEQEIVVDGEVVELDDMTFREQRELRDVIRGLTGDENFDIDGIGGILDRDLLPAMVYIFKKRTDPKYELEQALELKSKDVLKDKAKRPTRAVKAA